MIYFRLAEARMFSCVENEVCTSILWKTTRAEWPEPVVLEPFLSWRPFLMRQHLVLEMWDHNSFRDDVCLGRGIVPLRDACGAVPVPFICQLSRDCVPV